MPHLPHAVAQEGNNNCRRVSVPAGFSLNLRDEPSNDGDIEGQITRNAEVFWTGGTGGWRGRWVSVRATIDGEEATGWVWARYLTPCNQRARATPQTTTRVARTNVPSGSLCRRVTYDIGLSIHQEPNFSSQQVGSVLAGDRLQLASTEETRLAGAIWMPVKEPVSGWAAVRSMVRENQPLNVAYCN